MFANISQLKSRLSHYLARVKSGETIIVQERTTPIARLVPFTTAKDLQILEATASASKLRKIKPVKLRESIDVVEQLAASRGER